MTYLTPTSGSNTRSHPMPGLSPTITSALRLQTVKYATVASAASFVFDYLVTLDMEVEHIWKSQRFRIGEALFYVARYCPLLNLSATLYYTLWPHIPVQACHYLAYMFSWSTVIGIAAAEAIMILRTWALWGNSRPLLITLLVLFAAMLITDFALLMIFLRSLRFESPPLPTIGGCHPVQGRLIIFVDFALLIVFETIINVLTLWIGVKRFRRSSSPLVKVLYRDGAFYFIYIFVISAGNVVVNLATSRDYNGLLFPVQAVVHSILSTRAMLHVRSITSRESRSSTRPLSSLNFTPDQETHSQMGIEEAENLS